MKDTLSTLQSIAEGERVEEPGLYRMPIAVYHGECCPGPSVSSTGLRAIETECPAEFWAFSTLNPHAFARDDALKPAFSFGRAAHCLILGDEVFEEHFAVRPRAWRDYRTEAARAWRDEQIEAGRTPLTEADLTSIHGMAKALARHPVAESLVDGVIEPSLIWRDDETGIWLKARPDVLPISGVIADYKTIGRRAAPVHCFRAITEHAYYQQLALVAEGMEQLLGDRPDNAVLVFQQTMAPYHVTPVEICAEALAWGREANRRALRIMARCLEADDWPSYTDGIPLYRLPDWKVQELIARRTAANQMPTRIGVNGYGR